MVHGVNRRPVPLRLLPMALAAAFLTVQPLSIEAQSGDEGWWSTFLVPDVGIVYVRYGEPGGVNIVSDGGEPDSLSEPSGAIDVDLIQQLVQDEIRRYLDSEAARGLASAAPPGKVSRESALLAPRPVTPRTIVPSDSRPPSSPQGSLPQGPLPQEPPAPEPGEAPAETEPVSEEPIGSTEEPVGYVPVAQPPSVDPRQIREELLLTGLLRSNHILFVTDGSEILPYSYPILDAIAQVMKEIPEMRIRVEGHADHRGDSEYNLALSQRRADSVRRHLVSKLGVPADRLESKGFGEESPLAMGSNPTVLALNRRVEFRVLNLGELRD